MEGDISLTNEIKLNFHLCLANIFNELTEINIKWWKSKTN